MYNKEIWSSPPWNIARIKNWRIAKRWKTNYQLGVNSYLTMTPRILYDTQGETDVINPPTGQNSTKKKSIAINRKWRINKVVEYLALPNNTTEVMQTCFCNVIPTFYIYNGSGAARIGRWSSWT